LPSSPGRRQPTAGRARGVACRATATAKGAGTVVLRCRLRGWTLRARGAELRLATEFTPLGGTPQQATSTLRLTRR
jgi:hypothetical protein